MKIFIKPQRENILYKRPEDGSKFNSQNVVKKKNILDNGLSPTNAYYKIILLWKFSLSRNGKIFYIKDLTEDGSKFNSRNVVLKKAI